MNKLETYDTVVAINVDVQNDFCPGGSLAVTDGDQVVPPLNRLNEWTRTQKGEVIDTRDWHPRQTEHFDKWPVHCVQYTAGAAFHDNLLVEYPDTVASKGQSTKDDGYSGWEAFLDPESHLYRRGDGRYSLDVLTVGEAVEELVNPYNHGGKGRRRVAVVIGGLATDYCVQATVLDALKEGRKLEKTMRSLSGKRPDAYVPGQGYVEHRGPAPLAHPIGVFVLADAIRAVNLQPEDGAKALAKMQASGAILTTTDEVLGGQAFALKGA